MAASSLPAWLGRSRLAQRLLVELERPMTVKQIAKVAQIRWRYCSEILLRLAGDNLVYCLNPAATRDRIYWLTEQGRRIQTQLRRERDLPALSHDLGDVDWALVGLLSSGQRASVLKALSEPLRPAEIRRRIRMRDSSARMSINNVLDVVRLLVDKGIVEPVHERKRRRPLYRLTPLGRQVRVMVAQCSADTFINSGSFTKPCGTNQMKMN